MRMSRKMPWITAALVATSVLAGVGPAGATRDRPADGSGSGWEWYGGTATDVGDSADGPKKSNAYNLDYGGVVYRRGYWDVPLTQYQAGFAYQSEGDVEDGDGSPRISVFLATAEAVETGAMIFLDPYHCPSPYNSKGWATTDFFRSGSTCTIFTSYGSFTGDDATDPDGIPGNGDETPATSAWGEAIADTPNDETLASWGFLIADQPGTTKVDRVRFGGDVLSFFGEDASPDRDEDGVINRLDNCPGISNPDQENIDGDANGNACDSSSVLNGTYAGTSNTVTSEFTGSLDQAAVEGSPDGSYRGSIAGHDAAAGCYSLYGDVTFVVGSDSVTGVVDELVSTVCPTAATLADWTVDEYVMNMTLDINSGTGAWEGASGTVTFTGNQSARDSAEVRTSTGALTGTITPATP